MCQIWIIIQAIVNTLFLVVKVCVLNQSKGYQLLSHVLFIFSFTLFLFILIVPIKVLNLKNMNNFLTFEVTMIEKNNKLMENKDLFEEVFDLFLKIYWFFCFDFVLLSIFIDFSMFTKIVLIIVCSCVTRKRCIWVIGNTKVQETCTSIFCNIPMMK